MGRPRAFDEERVMHQVLQVFWKKGYGRTSLEDLEEATGLHRGSLYNAFGDKEELFRRSLEHYREWIVREGPFSRLAKGPEGMEAIQSSARAFLATLADPDMPDGCFFAFTSAEDRGTNPVVLRETSRGLDKARALMGGALREAQRRGELTDEVDPRDLGLAMIALVYGFQVLGSGGVPAEELQRGLDAVFAVMGAE